MIVIGHGFDDSYLGVRVRHYSFTTFLKYHFCERYFVIVLYVFILFYFILFSSCIAKGLAMCRLGV